MTDTNPGIPGPQSKGYLRGMLDYLMRPDDFRRDWYGELTNQIGHTFLGMFAAGLFVDLWFAVAGEMPVRWHVFLIVFLPYAVAIELVVQRLTALRHGIPWKLSDAKFDSLMYAFGVAYALAPFFEIDAREWVATLQYNVRLSLIIKGLWFATITTHIVGRYRQEMDAK